MSRRVGVVITVKYILFINKHPRQHTQHPTNGHGNRIWVICGHRVRTGSRPLVFTTVRNGFHVTPCLKEDQLLVTRNTTREILGVSCPRSKILKFLLIVKTKVPQVVSFFLKWFCLFTLYIFIIQIYGWGSINILRTNRTKGVRVEETPRQEVNKIRRLGTRGSVVKWRFCVD